jgi:hypothetical protein
MGMENKLTTIKNPKIVVLLKGALQMVKWNSGHLNYLIGSAISITNVEIMRWLRMFTSKHVEKLKI